MRLRWHLAAIEDLTRIHDYIAERNPEAARLVVRQVLSSVRRLETFSKSGRPGRAQDTREVVVNNLPYVIVYRDSDEVVDVLAVFHAARDRK